METIIIEGNTLPERTHEVVVKPNQSGRLGLFSLVPVMKGQLVFKEKSVFGAFIDCGNYSYSRASSLAQVLLRQYYRLTQDERTLFLSLTDNFNNAELSGVEKPLWLKILSVFKSNCKMYNESFANLGFHVSRVRHSCKPNSYLLTSSPKSFGVYAVSNIEAGDEITISYCIEKQHLGLLPTIERKNLLHRNLHFLCNCSFCNLPDEYSVGAYFSNEIRNIMYYESNESVGTDSRKKIYDILISILACETSDKMMLRVSDAFSLYDHAITIISEGIRINAVATDRVDRDDLKFWIEKAYYLRYNIGKYADVYYLLVEEFLNKLNPHIVKAENLVFSDLSTSLERLSLE